jgi:hypothetical protein
MSYWSSFFHNNIEKFLEIFSRLFNNRYQLFLFWIRSISIITLILQIQTLMSISIYAISLHTRRKLLLNELHTIGILFVSTIRRFENRPKSLFTSEKKFQKNFKRLKKMYDGNPQQRNRTI